MYRFKVNLYWSESDVTPDGFIEIAIECLHQGATMIKEKIIFAFARI